MSLFEWRKLGWRTGDSAQLSSHWEVCSETRKSIRAADLGSLCPPPGYGVPDVVKPREITFRTLAGKFYSLEAKDSFDEAWVAIGLRTAGTGTLKTLIDSRPSEPLRSYGGVISKYNRVLLN